MKGGGKTGWKRMRAVFLLVLRNRRQGAGENGLGDKK